MNSQISLFDSGYQLPDTPRILGEAEPISKPELAVLRQAPSGKVVTIQELKDFYHPELVKREQRGGAAKKVYPIKSHEELLAVAKWLMANKHPMYTLCFILGINIALRINELVSLRYKDILNPDGSIKSTSKLQDGSDAIKVYQSKTHKDRELFLNEGCCSVIRWYLNLYPKYDMDDYLFPGREAGTHISKDWIRKVLKKAADACGIQQNIGTHSLRKTFGYNLHEMSGNNISLVMEVLGHSSPAITLRYIGITQENVKEAYHMVSVDPIAEIFPKYRTDLEEEH